MTLEKKIGLLMIFHLFIFLKPVKWPVTLKQNNRTKEFPQVRAASSARTFNAFIYTLRYPGCFSLLVCHIIMDSRTPRIQTQPLFLDDLPHRGEHGWNKARTCLLYGAPQNTQHLYPAPCSRTVGCTSLMLFWTNQTGKKKSMQKKRF